MLKSPVAIHLPIVIDEHGGVKSQHTVCLVGIRLTPVAYLKGTVRSVAFCDEAIATAVLVIGIEVVSLFAIGISLHRHVWREQHVGKSGGVQQLSVGILIYFQDLTVVAPIVEAIHCSRPHHEFASAVVGDAAIVRTIDIHTLFAGLVWVFKHIGFPIGYVLPEWEIGITDCREFLLDGFRFAGT